VQASRDHECAVTEPTDDVHFPIWSLVGGKWTTFRAFAEQVTDRALERFGLDRKTSTESLAIGGGKDFPTTDDARSKWLADFQARTGLPEDRAVTLLDRYGTRANEVAGYLTAESDAPLANHPGYTRREIEFLLTEEKVMHLTDLVLRRTAIALLGELTPELLNELATIAAPILSWSPDQTQQDITRTKEILADRFGVKL
jgi:glycerol-3-phosphate dehydrogenase